MLGRMRGLRSAMMALALVELAGIHLVSPRDAVAQSRRRRRAGESTASTPVVQGKSADAKAAREKRGLIDEIRDAPRLAPQAKQLIEQGDWLGFRVFLRKNYSRIRHPVDWMNLRTLIYQNADHVGYDLVYAWDKRPPGKFVSSGDDLDINRARFEADKLLLEGRWEEAFTAFQRVAVELRRLRKISRSQSQIVNIDFLYPYIVHSMSRALYSAGRFDESYIVLRWIPQNYSKFRQIQFEKMWAAFRGGRIDQALGAVASQKSEYFSRFLPPEAYLVQIYLYKKLCRDDDYNQVLKEVRAFRKAIQHDKYTVTDWLESDIETRVLYNLMHTDPKRGSSLISTEDRSIEQSRIDRILKAAFKSYRDRQIDEIDKVLAYVQLTVKSGSTSILKPVERLPDRAALFKMNLEIWPADSAEEWIDEVGTHRFVGDSLCGSTKQN